MSTAKRADRILLLVTQADWGGVQSFLLKFADALQKDGRTVLLAAGGKGELWERAHTMGIQTRELRHVVREINPLEDWRAVYEIAALIDEFKPDAVHLNSSKMGVIGSLAASRSKTKPWVVYRIGGWAFLEPIGATRQWIYRTAEKWSAKQKDVIITVHPGDEALAKQLGIAPRGWLTSVPNGLDVASFVAKLKTRHDAREALGIPENAFVFATIAGAYPTKALVPYLDVLAKELRMDKNAYGVIIGDGPEENLIRQKHATLDVKDRIVLTGYLDGTVFYSAFDVFVLPSRKEGMPWTLLEAMAAGIPIIATDVGACRWMLTDAQHGNAGRVVPSGDADALFAAMDELRTHPEEREALARGGRATSARRFSWNETLRGNLGALDRTRT
ncbi:MAG: glycosyltransferase [Patescibacteria group bacterium]